MTLSTGKAFNILDVTGVTTLSSALSTCKTVTFVETLDVTVVATLSSALSTGKTVTFASPVVQYVTLARNLFLAGEDILRPRQNPLMRRLLRRLPPSHCHKGAALRRLCEQWSGGNCCDGCCVSGLGRGRKMHSQSVYVLLPRVCVFIDRMRAISISLFMSISIYFYGARCGVAKDRV